MNSLHAYYRALLDYRKTTVNSRECTAQRSATAKAGANDDKVTLKRHICTVRTDWIEAIEEGLVHVDKAIREERQFIRSNGEVVDIEKVKNVSKDSVVHLAQHSNLITRFEEGQDIIPDKLYTVEKLNDYAVYENRFLYMLLCYLRDFITLRYNKILDLEHTYHADMVMDKTVVMPKRSITLHVSLTEERKDDPFLKERSASRGVIARIRDCLELVHAYLDTPLMQEVSKVAMLKPPVTKTNVLRMNHNFRGALQLYEYVSAYNEDGYSVREELQKIQPFRMDMADEFSEIGLLASFLTYEYGMNVKEALRHAYDLEEEKNREAEKAKHLEQLKALRRRIRESGESPEEYMLMLEKRNRSLEIDRENLLLAQKEIEQLNASVAQLEIEKNQLTADIAAAAKAADEREAAHAAELLRIENEQQRQIEALNEAHTEQMERAAAAHSEALAAKDAEMTDMCEQHKAALDKAEEESRARLTALAETHHRAMEDVHAKWRAECDEWSANCRERDDKIHALGEENDTLLEARRLSDARLQALRHEHGLTAPDADFTSRESFEELEHQLEVFKSFFKKEWGKTKSKIRKNAFSDFRKALREGKEKEFLAGNAAAPQEDEPVEAAASAEEQANATPQAKAEPITAAPTVEEVPTETPAPAENIPNAQNQTHENEQKESEQ